MATLNDLLLIISNQKSFIQQNEVDSLMTIKNRINNCQSYINSICQESDNNDKDDKHLIHVAKRKIEEKITELEKSNTDCKELNARIAELKSALQELNTLIASQTQYQIEIDKNAPQFSFDGTTATVKYNGDISSLLHELKHAFQFETGKIDFILINNGVDGPQFTPGLTYDLTDEVDAYKRQFAYDGILKFRVELTDEELLKEIRIKGGFKDIGVREIKMMNKIKTNVIVKISDGFAVSALYKFIPNKPIDKKSKIKDVLKHNKRHRKDIIKGLGLDSISPASTYIDFVKIYIINNPYIYVK